MLILWFFAATVSLKNNVAEQLEPVIDNLIGFLEINLNEDDDSGDEAVDRKLTQHLSSALSVVALQLPAESHQCSQVLKILFSI